MPRSSFAALLVLAACTFPEVNIDQGGPGAGGQGAHGPGAGGVGGSGGTGGSGGVGAASAGGVGGVGGAGGADVGGSGGSGASGAGGSGVDCEVDDDLDGDGFVNEACGGDDCYDDPDSMWSVLANPDATAFQTLDRGDGSFDYDCDGVEEPQYEKGCGACIIGGTVYESPGAAGCGDLVTIKNCLALGSCVGGNGTPGPLPCR